MNSCVASSCTCSPKVSYAFAILASWPIGDVPLSCRYAFTCLARHNNRRRIKMPLARTVSGVVPSVVDRWWSSKGLRLRKCNFVPHHCSLLPHETLSPTRILHASQRALSLCALTQNKTPFSTSSAPPPRYSLARLHSRRLLPCSTAQSPQHSTPLSPPIQSP